MNRNKIYQKAKESKDKKKKDKPGAGKGLNRESLREELSDPQKMMFQIQQLESLLKSHPTLLTLRFPPDQLLEYLEEFLDEHRTQLQQLSNPDAQREFILQNVLEEFLTEPFVKRIDRQFMKYLDQKDRTPEDIKIIGAGLFFLEVHRRQRRPDAQNPLWSIIFNLSYDEALSTSGGRIRYPESQISSPETKLPGPNRSLEDELPEQSWQMIHKAIVSLETDEVDFSFSFETILQGLRIYCTLSKILPTEKIMTDLHATYLKEIGITERSDLLWGLEYAMEQSGTDIKRIQSFRTVYDSILLLPRTDNPVLFALYCKSVLQFYRYVRPDEYPFVELIINNPNDIQPIMQYACSLLENESPKRSLKAFEAATAIEPDYGVAKLGAGLALWMMESFREARLVWDRASENLMKKPSDPVRLDSLIALCRNLANLDDDTDIPSHALDVLYRETGYKK